MTNSYTPSGMRAFHDISIIGLYGKIYVAESHVFGHFRPMKSAVTPDAG
ncbi:hypothetical protein [Novosphingobium mathurense]|nr:hypothetical protein [Novosphingobium mathurense]